MRQTPSLLLVSLIAFIGFNCTRSNVDKTVATVTPTSPSPEVGWKTIQSSDFSFRVPATFTNLGLKGHDTELWAFKDQGIDTEAEYGLSASSAYLSEDACRDKTEATSDEVGYKTRTVRCEKISNSQQGEAIVLVREFWIEANDNKLVIECIVRDSEKEAVAKGILDSVRFRK